ncbi:tyrosine-type recombinase/integrase [Sphingomonas adhaesiva]|uniref:tyrosine-type recombinase/integrase n=1 Tax=Sphingomonas adhaesiva TaxID=28212 RepID=UPI002FF55CB6
MTHPATPRSRGRPRRFRELENLRDNPPANAGKRAHYVNGIGLLHGTRGITVYLKIKLSHGRSLEKKVGRLESWDWQSLEEHRCLLQGRADRGESLEEKKPITFAEHSDAWLARKKISAKGYGTLKGHVETHLKPSFGKKLLKDITTADVNAWITRQRGRKLGPATVARQLSTLNAILNDAVKSSVIDKNPGKIADKIGGCEPRQRFFDAKQVERILKTADAIDNELAASADEMPQAKTGWLRDFIVWALHSGMRRGEIASLELDDIAIVPNGSMVVMIRTSKSGKPRVINATKGMRAIYERLKEREREDGSTKLFPVSLTTIKRRLTKLWAKCGLEDARLHDLRRTNATILCQSGMDMRTVAGRLGHSDIKMLMSTYAVYSDSGNATNLTEIAFNNFS